MNKIDNLNDILKSFNVRANCCNYTKVRNVSLYDLHLEPGTRVKDIGKFSDELSIFMKAKSRPLIRIIPELGIVRLEVVDDNPYKISFFDEFYGLEKPNGIIPMYLGSSINGQNVWMDMAKNPHLLIAGTTGSGKSTLLQVIMANALGLPGMKVSIIDTKNVEYNEYNRFDNVSVATNYVSGINALTHLVCEMEYRYKLLNNKELTSESFGFSKPDFPNILVLIDEFADLILQDDSKVFYNLLCRLVQKSRAAGIYCIMATQRPSVDVVKGSIKANFPARISCQVASSIDSKVILGTGGAELLAGSGDSIIKNYDNNYQRFQSAYTTPEEVCAYYAFK